MNGREIEALARQIEENVKLSRTLLQQETIRYIQQHQQQIVHDLVRRGEATIKTNVGDLSLTLEDLSAAAA